MTVTTTSVMTGILLTTIEVVVEDVTKQYSCMLCIQESILHMEAYHTRNEIGYEGT